MRDLSEIKGEEAMDVTAELIAIGRIVTKDEELRKYLGQRPKNISKAEWNIDFANAFYNSMLEKHRKECIKVLALVNGVSEEEYLSDMGIEKLYEDMNALMSSQTFVNLFFSSVPRKVIVSGSSSANTTDQKA